MRDHGTNAWRKNAPGQLLARGPLDYDVPVARRCEQCGGVFEAPLGESPACPYCQRYAGAA